MKDNKMKYLLQVACTDLNQISARKDFLCPAYSCKLKGKVEQHNNVNDDVAAKFNYLI